MSLSKRARSYLRRLSHELRPVIHVGAKGLTPALTAELDRALDHHELVKVQLAIDDRDARAEAARQLAATARAELVQEIGKVASLYRANPREPRLALP